MLGAAADALCLVDLLPEASILYASESVVDVLGFQPAEVVGRSCFTYFHPDELRRAHTVYNRGIDMDKAAVLHYARIQNRDGLYITCECVFTVVYDVLVACTSIYRGPGDVKNARKLPYHQDHHDHRDDDHHHRHLFFSMTSRR